MSSPIDSLNDRQREAATTIEGPLLVLAGAGTGKTKVITCRIAYMIEHGIAPGSILGVTFTNKAAREMRERLDQLISPEAAKHVTLGTFHSFCAKILHRYVHLAGHYNSSFSIADDADQISLVRQAAAELGYSKDEIDTKAALAYIGRKKNEMQWPEDALAADADSYSDYAHFARIYERYQQMLELQNTLDFDDMMLITLKLLEQNEKVLKYCRDTYKYLLVDEYQDTNAAQFRIIQLIAGETMNLCVVGDDDQSIYSWRGAVVSNILDFPKHFPGAKEIKLEQNYRSTNSILKTANAIIAANSARYDKNLWSAKGTGDTVKVFRLQDGESEARFVVDAISNIIRKEPDRCWSDFAVLFRSNHLSRSFEQEFRHRGITPKIIGGQAFFQRKEVKDAAAYLKLLINKRDDQNLLRILSVPPRGLGDKAILTLRDLQKQMKQPLLDILGSPEYHALLSKAAAKSAGELHDCIARYTEAMQEPGELASRVSEYLTDVGYLNGIQKVYKNLEESEKRRENVLEFINYIGIYEVRQQKPCTLAEFMESYSLMDENDRTDDDEDVDGPILSTVHASKGLEFPVVFIVGLEQGLFPHERALSENGEEEERRLFYVAVTRAREELYITCAAARFKYHEFVRQLPSVFLRSLPEDCVEKPDLEDFIQPEPVVSDEELRNAFANILKELRS
ncbi:MAG: UvrD-helicase domain-containing protein [Lentisphaeria bacterium]|nr:UvrD-helicase domain-containing protein [Lentisphaeria bacterium]